MADEIKLKAPTVEQQVVVNINGEEKLRSFADTLDKISNNKNLQKYWKTQQELINATANAYGNFQKKASKDNATELIKVTNALKAMSGTDLSNILPDFDKISKAMAEAQKVVGNIDSAFSVKGFKEAFDSFETLKAYSEDIEKIFSHFGVSSDVGELQNNVRALEGEVEKLTRRLANAKNANEELRNEFNNFKSGSGFADKLDELDNLKSEMSYIREEAEETFRQFLKLNNVSEDGYDRDGFYDDNRFREYFQNIQSGYMSASDAIRQFKTEYSYLLEESFKTNNDTFGLEQLQAFSNKLDSIFRQVEETSTKINDIISNGVITKSVENLSIDSSLSDSQRSLFGNLLQDEESLKSITALFQKLIEESNKTSKVDLFNDEQLQQVLSIFDKMEGHLSSLRSIISDVGDGEEFSPLLKMINNVQSSISELATSVKGIGLNMNIDVGSDSEMEAKVQSKIANALQAYQRLFDHIKMSGAGGSVINTNFFEFDINQYDTMMGKLQGYKKFIDNMRKEAKAQFNGQDVLYQDTEKSFWTQASSAAGQVTKAFNEMKAASDTNPLKDLFGSGDLSEVVSQLGLIVKKLEEISNTASSFKNAFDNGFNVTASVEEIDKLTNRVKELEDELSKVKLSPIGVDKSNISSPIKDTIQEDKIQETVSVVDKLEEEIQEITVATDKAGKALEEYKEKWKVLKQVGDVGDDKYSATFEKNAGQIESVVWKAKRDADGNVLFDSNGEKEYEMLSVTISNYQKLESVIVSADNELRKLEERRQNLLKQNPTASTSGLDAQIAYQKNYISLLEQTVKHISQADEYLLEEQQIIEARNKAEKEYQLTKGSKQDESVAKDYQKRNDAITKANRLLNTQEKTVEHIAKTYDRALNPDLEKSVNNPNDLAELAQKKSEIQTLINQLKNAPRDASNEQEYLRLEKLIAEYKDLADYKKKANNPTKQELGGQKLETLVAQTVAEYDKLIIRAEKYGDATKEIVEKLKQQRDLLAQTDSNGKYTANANDFYSARDVLKVQKADFGVFEASEKAIKIREKELEAVRKISAEKQKLQEKDRKSSVDTALKDQLSAWKDIQSIREKIAKTTNEEELSILNQQKKNAQQQYLSAEKVLKANVDLYDNEARLSEMEKIRLETNRKLVSYGESQVKAINDLVNNNQVHLDKLRPTDGNRSVEFENAVQEYNKAIIALREFQATLDATTPLTKEQSDKFEELANDVKKARLEIDKIPKAQRGSDEDARMKEIDKLTKYLDANTRISKEAKQQLQGYLALLKSGDPSVNVKELHTAWTKVAVAEREAGREGKKFWDILTDKAVYGAAAQLAGYYLSLTDFIRYGQEGVQVIRELDTALTEMRKVSDETVSSLEKFQKASFDLADSVGATAVQIQNSTADWMRLGESIEEAAESARVSNILLNVSEFESINEATDSLVAMSSAYQDLEKMDIVDKLNEVGNNYAISTDGIATALQRSASALTTAGNDIDKAVALVTAGNAVVQDPDSVGAGLRTIALRLTGTKAAKEELEELGEETDGVTTTVSKLRDTIMSATKVASNGFKGFDILDENGNYKSTYEILKGISQIYQEIVETDKKTGSNNVNLLLETMAGKNRANIAASILQNSELLEDVYNSSANESSGSAQEELEKYLDSIEGKIAQFQNEVQEFWYNLISSETVKKFVDFGTTTLDKVTSALGSLGTIGLGAGLFAGVKNIENIGENIGERV